MNSARNDPEMMQELHEFFEAKGWPRDNRATVCVSLAGVYAGQKALAENGDPIDAISVLLSIMETGAIEALLGRSVEDWIAGLKEARAHIEMDEQQTAPSSENTQ